MNISVIATASWSSGALTIYKQFIDHLKENVREDKYLLFLHKSMPQPHIKGVTYYSIDTTSTLRRLLFDYYKCSQILKKKDFQPDLIISLQNTGVYSLKHITQCIYYHQPLPFYNRKWNLLMRDERKFYYYKNFYPFFVKKSIGKHTFFIAQIPFIKDGIVNTFNIQDDKVKVYMPDVESINSDDIPFYDYGDNKKHFVYPAIPAKYKEHETLIRALSLIQNKDDVVLHFTFSLGDYPELEKLVCQLKLTNNVSFEGKVEHQKLLSMLKSSKGLLFPSTIETLGLPLLEAAFLGLPIVAADVVYAKQVLHNYTGVSFVDAYNYNGWAKKLEQLSETVMRYDPIIASTESSWDDFFKWIHKIVKKTKSE